MGRIIGVLAAGALLTFFVAVDTSFAAPKKQTESCLGGGCVGTNPNRVRPDYYSSYYKRSSKSKKHTSSSSGEK